MEFEDIIFTIESYFDFAWRIEESDDEKELYNLNKITRLLDNQSFEKYMTDEECYIIDKLYNYIYCIENECTLASVIEKNINDKCKYIYSIYKKILKGGCSGSDSKYLKILHFPFILDQEHDEFYKLILPNQMTIKNLIQEYIPDVKIFIKIGLYGPGIYLYTDKWTTKFERLYEFLDSFYFGTIVKKYILLTNRATNWFG